MKHYRRFLLPAQACLECPVFSALLLLLVALIPGPVCSDGQPGNSGLSLPLAWRGSASVDSAQGTSVYVRVYDEDVALALSMTHPTAGTAGFTGFSEQSPDELGISMNFDSPGLVVGDLGLAGLSRFLFRPAGAGPLLPVYGHKPLRSERPDGTRYRGFVLGRDSGLIAVYPLRDPSLFASGTWFSPADSPVSVLFLAGSEPGGSSDAWYEADRPRVDRLWGAISLGLAQKGRLHRMTLSGALATSAGLPGMDGMATRLEAMLAIRRLRLDAELSFASEGWQAPDGATAVPLRFGLSTLYRHRGLELSAAYRLVHKSLASEEQEALVRGHVLLGSGDRELKLATSISQAAGQALPDFYLDTRCKPGLFPALLPGLVFETAWKTKDGQAERFDAGASLRGAGKVRWSLDGNLRYDTKGRHIKGSASVLTPLGDGSLRFGLKTDGWLPLAGELPEAPVVLSIVWSFSSP